MESIAGFPTAKLDRNELECQHSNMLEQKLNRLKALLQGYSRCLVAYSGGVDSVFLACVSHQVLGENALAIIADSPSLPRRELEEALSIASRFGFRVRVVETKEFDNEQYTSNPQNRCYFCKQELFSHLVPIATSEGFPVIAYGENASDIADFRPGAQAAAEFQIKSPLKEVGLSKNEIRELSALMGLPTAEKPQMACLSSRIPTGEPVSPAKLRMIETAENSLRDMGFFDVRVRHHELSQGVALARVELGPGDFQRFLSQDLAEPMRTVLQSAGYRHATLDLAPYQRPGSDSQPRQSNHQASAPRTVRFAG